jgi:cation-transporting ATPase 13A3/4/5
MAEMIEINPAGGRNRDVFRSIDTAEISRDSDLPVQTPVNVELEGKISRINLAQISCIRFFFYVFFSICTGGLFWLLCYWLPKLRVFFTLASCDLKTATRVVVFGADGTMETKDVKKQKTSKEETKFFEYRMFKYIYNFDSSKFVPAQFQADKISFNDLAQVWGKGLNNQAYQDNLTYYGENMTDIGAKGFLLICAEEASNPFYLFQVFSVIVWCFDFYYVYSGIIAFFSITSIITTAIEKKRNRTRIREMSFFECQVLVHRNNGKQPERMSSKFLVPGDVFEVPEQFKVPCDAILLTGTCIMNEAMLTGESIPVIKNPIPQSNKLFDPEEDKQYLLYSGTMCIRARNSDSNAPVLAMATHTGFTTVKGELIRTMLFPKPSNFKLYSDSLKFILLLAVMAIVEISIDLDNFLKRGDEVASEKITIKSLEIITVTVPPALPTCMTIGIAFAIERLKKAKIFCIEDQKINEAGRVNVFCFDKTGTLTEEGLDMLGAVPIIRDPINNKAVFHDMVREIDSLGAKENDIKFAGKKLAIEIMASCHSITRLEDKSGQSKFIGDPLDIKMFESTKWTLIEGDKIKSLGSIAASNPDRDHIKAVASASLTGDHGIGILRRNEFASKYQRMSVIVRNTDGTGPLTLHIKGSPEKIRELCVNSTVPRNFHTMLNHYTQNGYRVLAVATRTLQLDNSRIQTVEREEVEKDLDFAGFIIMENKLKPITTEIIEVLQRAAIKVVMVTGDNVLTAISVARQCGIVKAKQRVFLGDISEKKASNGQNFIEWKDFEFSANTLDPKDLTPSRTNSIMEGVHAHKIPTHEIRLKTNERNDEVNISVGKVKIDVEDLQPLSGGRVNNKTENIGKEKSGKDQFNEEKVDYAVVSMENPFEKLDPNDDYVIAITGKAFSHILKEVAEKNEKSEKILKILMEKAAVFARMHPDEKATMVKNMQGVNNNIVGMCGDGANDCSALKMAHVGISLSEAEASIAAPFTSQVQDIACVPALLKSGRAALVTSYQCFKYMALYSVIQSTTITIVYFFLIDLSTVAYYYEDIILILPLAFSMGFTGSYDKLTIHFPTERLMSFPVLLSVLGQAAIAAVSQIVGVQIYLAYDDQNCLPNFTPPMVMGPEGELVESDPVVCALESTLFLIAIFQLVANALAFMVGKPFRKPFYTNWLFTMFLIVLTFFNLMLCLNPFGATFWEDTGESRVVSSQIYESGFSTTIIVIAIINSVITLFWEWVAVNYISLWYKRCTDKKFGELMKKEGLEK